MINDINQEKYKNLDYHLEETKKKIQEKNDNYSDEKENEDAIIEIIKFIIYLI